MMRGTFCLSALLVVRDRYPALLCPAMNTTQKSMWQRAIVGGSTPHMDPFKSLVLSVMLLMTHQPHQHHQPWRLDRWIQFNV